jgi:hypothetical protein
MFGQEPSRIQPLGPASAYLTYSISATRDTGVVAACRDVGCPHWRDGWDTIVDESDLSPFGGKARADYIRSGQSGRTFREAHTATGLTVFRFDPYQRCFTEHRTRPDLFTRRDGDWRGNPTGRVYRHTRAEDWAEDFQEHEGALADQRKQG